jgi:hypothetical protein
MAAFGDCSSHLIHSVETQRARLSARVANAISKRTGVSEEWLLSDDPQAPMTAVDGRPFTLKTFERRQLDFHFSEGAHFRWREVQLGVGFDLWSRLLRAAQSEGKVRELMEYYEDCITTKLKDFPALKNTIDGEHRRAQEAASKAGKTIPLGKLTPLGVESLKRGRVRLAQAIATVTAGAKRKKRAKP